MKLQITSVLDLQETVIRNQSHSHENLNIWAYWKDNFSQNRLKLYYKPEFHMALLLMQTIKPRVKKEQLTYILHDKNWFIIQIFKKAAQVQDCFPAVT